MVGGLHGPLCPALGAARFAPSSCFCNGNIIMPSATAAINTVIVNEARNYGPHQLLRLPLLVSGRLTFQHPTLPSDASLGLWQRVGAPLP